MLNESPKPVAHAPRATAAVAAKPDRPTCHGSVKAITYYRRVYRASREAMSRPGPVPRVWYRGCNTVRRLALEWRDKADMARVELIDWRQRQYAWEDWLPDGWYRVGSCETGYGGPPNWHHRNSRYEGAFGFAVTTWDRYAGEAQRRYGDGPYPSSAADATPRQQYNVALTVYHHFGLSGWGCRGAYYG